MLPLDEKDDWAEVRDHYGAYYTENRTDQLLGATVRAVGDTVVACAPNYRLVTRIHARHDAFRQGKRAIY